MKRRLAPKKPVVDLRPPPHDAVEWICKFNGQTTIVRTQIAFTAKQLAAVIFQCEPHQIELTQK